MKYLSFKEFVEKYRLKNEATSNVKIKEILKLMNITECGIYMRDDKFNTTSGFKISLTYIQLKEHTGLCFLVSFILIHMDAHHQLIYSIKVKCI